MSQSHPWTKMTQGKLPWRQYRKNHISPKRPSSLTLSDALSPIFSRTKSWLSESHWPSIVFGAHATCTLKFISPDQWINAGKWLKVRSLSFETSNISLKVKISVVEMTCVSFQVYPYLPSSWRLSEMLFISTEESASLTGWSNPWKSIWDQIWI